MSTLSVHPNLAHLQIRWQRYYSDLKINYHGALTESELLRHINDSTAQAYIHRSNMNSKIALNRKSKSLAPYICALCNQGFTRKSTVKDP